MEEITLLDTALENTIEKGKKYSFAPAANPKNFPIVIIPIKNITRKQEAIIDRLKCSPQKPES